MCVLLPGPEQGAHRPGPPSREENVSPSLREASLAGRDGSHPHAHPLWVYQHLPTTALGSKGHRVDRSS